MKRYDPTIAIFDKRYHSGLGRKLGTDIDIVIVVDKDTFSVVSDRGIGPKKREGKRGELGEWLISRLMLEEKLVNIKGE